MATDYDSVRRIGDQYHQFSRHNPDLFTVYPLDASLVGGEDRHGDP